MVNLDFLFVEVTIMGVVIFFWNHDNVVESRCWDNRLRTWVPRGLGEGVRAWGPMSR